jgi:UDP-2,3-diacylglucosamine hydrolase
LLDDPTKLDLFGKATSLTNGDTLCTDDREYQALRAEVRSEPCRRAFLKRPLALRKEQIGALRARSEKEKHQIMDVNRATTLQ